RAVDPVPAPAHRCRVARRRAGLRGGRLPAPSRAAVRPLRFQAVVPGVGRRPRPRRLRGPRSLPARGGTTPAHPGATATATVEDAPFGPAVAAFDAAVDRALDRLRGDPVADRVFYTASALGDWSLLWHLIGLARAAVDPAWRRDELRLSTVLVVESLTVNQGVKRLFKRRRPAVEADDR